MYLWLAGWLAGPCLKMDHYHESPSWNWRYRSEMPSKLPLRRLSAHDKVPFPRPDISARNKRYASRAASPASKNHCIGSTHPRPWERCSSK